ncbi:MAG: hypothetical protein K2X90_01490 [Candidatus Babeliaceae bacterium]|nr:hypothetical protein [Candidatus Babeliaceae bacterium]
MSTKCENIFQEYSFNIERLILPVEVDPIIQEEANLLARVQAEQALRRAQAMAAEAARVAALANQRQEQGNPGPYRRLFR